MSVRCSVAKWYGQIDLLEWVYLLLLWAPLLEEGMPVFACFLYLCLFLFNLCSLSEVHLAVKTVVGHVSQVLKKNTLLLHLFFGRKDACSWRGSCIASALGIRPLLKCSYGLKWIIQLPQAQSACHLSSPQHDLICLSAHFISRHLWDYRTHFALDSVGSWGRRWVDKSILQS